MAENEQFQLYVSEVDVMVLNIEVWMPHTLLDEI